MKAQLVDPPRGDIDGNSKPGDAAERADAAVAGDAGRETELVAVSTGYGLVAIDSPRSEGSSADATPAALTDIRHAPQYSPKRRVSFAKKLAGAVIQVHADGTAGTAEPLLGPDHAASTPTLTASVSAADSHDAAPPSASVPEDLELGRSGLRSGRKKAPLSFKTNAIVPMPGSHAAPHNPLYDSPPSRSVSGPAAHVHIRCAQTVCRFRPMLDGTAFNAAK